MELSDIYVKFGHPSVSDATQGCKLTMIFDLGEDQPLYELNVQHEFEKDLDASLLQLRERAKDGALATLREAVRLLEQYSIAELDQQADDRRRREAADLEQSLGVKLP